jgi:hypothetical protein
MLPTTSTQRLMESKGFLGRMLLFIQAVSHFYNYYHSTIWNNNQHTEMDPDSSICTATRYGLIGPDIESWWGATFSAPVQTGPETHPAFCTMGTGYPSRE